jgi:hypothetical protein
VIRVGVTSFDAKYVGAEVGHEHAGVGARSDPGQLDDLQSV